MSHFLSSGWEKPHHVDSDRGREESPGEYTAVWKRRDRDHLEFPGEAGDIWYPSCKSGSCKRNLKVWTYGTSEPQNI
jgi:hypothetical protein